MGGVAISECCPKLANHKTGQKTLARANLHNFCQRAAGNQPPMRKPSSGTSREPASQPTSQHASQLASQPASQPTTQPANQPAGQPNHKPASQPAWLASPPANSLGKQAATISQPVPSQVCHLRTDPEVNKFPKGRSPSRKHFEGLQRRSITDTKAVWEASTEVDHRVENKCKRMINRK